MAFLEPEPQIKIAKWMTQIGASGIGLVANCYPACLAMILNHYGHNVSVADVERTLGRPKDMDRGYFITDAVTPIRVTYGVELGWFGRMREDALLQSLKMGKPVIALIDYEQLPSNWKKDRNYRDNHYVVIVGYEGGRVHYLDPF